MEAYLGPDRPRWSPKDEADIREVVEQGWLVESHHIDVKREVGDGRGDRKETARDLASFAVDGGALLIGVDEDKPNRTFSLAPQPLDGLMEKLEQVAAFVVGSILGAGRRRTRLLGFLTSRFPGIQYPRRKDD
jgi:hypothetical protein